MPAAKIELPRKLHRVFAPKRGDVRYRAAYGGRGSGKSFSFALMAAVWGFVEPLRILATRELQISIKESFYAEVRNAIESKPWLADHYEVGESFIRGRNGTEFIFRGLRHNMSAIKSMAQIDLCIIEEGEDVPEHSWTDLEPTIRAPKSEIWTVWNPKREGSPVDNRFIKNPSPDAVIAKVNHSDNPWFPAVLEKQRLRDKAIMDDAKYRHIWEGEYLRNSDSQIFAGRYEIKEFTPGDHWEGPYCGLDFGFSTDPTAAVKAWVDSDVLYVEYEAGGTGIELDDTAREITSKIPGFERYTIYADSARPESISYLQRHGLPRIRGVKKWAGSVEDGVEHIKSYRKVIIHPRCKNTAREFSLYSYKVDKHTGEVLPNIVDAYNHYCDGLRYALSSRIRNRQVIFKAL